MQKFKSVVDNIITVPFTRRKHKSIFSTYFNFLGQIPALLSCQSFRSPNYGTCCNPESTPYLLPDFSLQCLQDMLTCSFPNLKKRCKSHIMRAGLSSVWESGKTDRTRVAQKIRVLFARATLKNHRKYGIVPFFCRGTIGDDFSEIDDFERENGGGR